MNRMSASDWTVSQDGSDFAFRRGFTGHEHYDRFGIINMNARLYDPVLGRFFSPDPQVQNPSPLKDSTAIPIVETIR